MDDGDILCHPALVLPFLLECDVAKLQSWCGAELPEDSQRLGLRAS